MDISTLLPVAIQAAEEACQVILEVYNSDNFEAEAKGDQSPLTLADRRAHAVISQRLAQTQLPVLSEEGKQTPYAERRHWSYFWMVDPLDGTKEFIKRNGDFTVNIALIHGDKPVMGVVAVPVTGDVYYGGARLGAFLKRQGVVTALPSRLPADLTLPGLRVVASRSHMNPETEEFIARLKEPVLVSRGSSLKFLMLAEGEADVYPRYAPTMEWDTAAAHAVVQGVGLQVCQPGGHELVYNKADLLNPFFQVG